MWNKIGSIVALGSMLLLGQQNTATINGVPNQQIAFPNGVFAGGTIQGFFGPGTTLPTPTGTNGGIFIDPSGNLYAEEAGGTISGNRICTALNSACSGGITNTTLTIGTSTISGNTCTSPATAVMSGLTTSSVIIISSTASNASVTGWGSTGGLAINVWPTANTLNYEVCNQTSSSITPSASVTFNVGAK